MGVDEVITHPFSREIAATEPEDFIELLIKHLNIKHLWVGYDFALGKDRKGDVAFLTELGTQLGFEVHVIKAFEMDGDGGFLQPHPAGD